MKKLEKKQIIEELLDNGYRVDYVNDGLCGTDIDADNCNEIEVLDNEGHGVMLHFETDSVYNSNIAYTHKGIESTYYYDADSIQSVLECVEACLDGEGKIKQLLQKSA